MTEHEMTEYEAPQIERMGDFDELTMWYGWASADGEGDAII